MSRTSNNLIQKPEGSSFEVSWDGDKDPSYPRNFTKLKKWTITFIVSHVSLCVTCASSIYTSTYEGMEAQFHNSRIVSTLGLSTFVLGISLGPMLLSPLSELYGRRPIYLASWSLYIIFLIPQLVAKNIATMLVFRFLDGLLGSTFLAVSGGTIRDLFASKEIGAPMAVFAVSPFIGPSLGPLVGGFINYYTDWRWTYYVLMIWSIPVWLTIVLFVPETFHPMLLKKKAKQLRTTTGDNRWIAPMEPVEKSIAQIVGTSLLRPFQLLIFEPMCLSLSVFSAILLGILYLFFGAFPLVFGAVYQFKLYQTGISFLGIMCGMLIPAVTGPFWNRIASILDFRDKGEKDQDGEEPEGRLPPAIVGSFLVPAGIFVFGWAAYSRVHWMVPIVGSAIFGLGTMLVFTGIFTFLVDAYPLYAASALAANAFVRCLFAAAFPLFGTQMYETLGIQWASSLLAFLTVAMIPFPFLFLMRGKRIRARSRFATSLV
ncbi:MFS transporter [Metarhizium robertsii]|uniref:MFS transporter n=1 Tax=Metarhizium robertsii TaxID=568076 RepID=A0A014N802_9HYPO|nr:MFS transporter [Metarhizium robertsii]